MSVEHFKMRIDALSGEHSLEILYFLQERGWSIALDIARNLQIHPTTVKRYLSKMHKSGIISKRPKRCRTQTTFEYNLLSQKITLELDLRDNPNGAYMITLRRAYDTPVTKRIIIH